MSKILNAQMHAWLQVFACAARHLSFTRCADELHVTPGAISQQMRQLEERLGFALFHRVGRGLELTAEGQRLAIVANEVHSRIDDELRLLHSGRIGGVFKLRCIPSFLSKWLMPRLPQLEQAFPDIQLRIIAEDSSGSLRDDDFDLAIDLNDGSYPGLMTTSLLEEELFPVCSPALQAGKPPLDTPSQLVHYPLLHDITAWRGSYEYAEWEFYLNAIGASGIDVRRGHTFNRNHLTIEAAIMGMGVAIARKALITNELEEGSLIIPFGHPIAARKKYVLVYREGALQTPARRAVHDWLVEQALGM
ncbi:MULTISPECIES: LysR substrate-binding domain-containing protein [Pseudomonas]|jgi:LysR family glycine cleavage system transcriptional activator|uniref:LysR family transcriptional regulator n=4 Tax=Pseudomonas TaxID=286 RepID=A0A1Y3NVL8_9PSED|nr:MULTISPECIES: LysR substrate-binding domain-containing protein [Pseudomonas]MCQ2995233.1 LysR substrate-binding domain-containing protein [Pseudomonas syringae]MDG6403541.1 LysR substrate-binding domain-containing protein [Pseudomonas quasicaspiana]MBC3953290.1 LysR family transcriptional regulator [Pseudomonas folii]MCI8209734.1 LysR family transcriptional regulator [Pseudomonas sp. S25]MCQ3030128.1 LysR substrate-binding domain-containing protein [Pseudomonas syringae]